MKALKEKLDVLKKGAEVSETELVELKKKLRTAESEAKKAQDAVKNNKVCILGFDSGNTVVLVAELNI